MPETSDNNDKTKHFHYTGIFIPIVSKLNIRQQQPMGPIICSGVQTSIDGLFWVHEAAQYQCNAHQVSGQFNLISFQEISHEQLEALTAPPKQQRNHFPSGN